MLILRSRFLITLAVSFLVAGEGYSQFVEYVGFSGGVGSYTNDYDASLLNYFNPRRNGPELNLFVGRQWKRIGWEGGVTYRNVRHFTLAKVQNTMNQSIDTARSSTATDFFLVPLYLTYRIDNPKWMVGVRAGLYGGWKTHASSELILSSGSRYVMPVNWTRFPRLDTFGGQAGIEVLYKINRTFSLYCEGRLIVDASGLLFPKYHNYTNTYANYHGRVFTVGINYQLYEKH